MTANPILLVTDGVTSVNLIESNSGFGIKNWTPAIADLKGGGVWQNSPMADGRRLVIHHFDNVVETFNLSLNAGVQDDVIEKSQNLRRLLQQARDYWSSDRNDIRPVYIKARAPFETNTRYALIYDWKTPNDANPFTMPFFQCGSSTIAEMTLVVERGHWQADAPLSSTCVQINNQQSYDEAGNVIAVTYTDETSPSLNIDVASEDSAELSDSHRHFWDSLRFGCDYSDIFENAVYEMAVRFRGVNIPKHAKIDVAYITFVSSTNQAVTYDSTIYAEKKLYPDGFWAGQFIGQPGYEDICLRPRFYGAPGYPPVVVTDHNAAWTIPATVAGNSYNTPSLVGLVQEMVDLPYWTPNDMVFFIQNPSSDPCTLTFEYLKHFYSIGANAPVLHIEYRILDDATYGQENTCDSGVVFVSNKHNRANISHMYRYDASGASYSGNLMAGVESLPFDILPATPAVNDIVYFGIDITLENSGPFCSLVFDVGEVAEDNVEGKWQYYNGAWTDLDVTDNTIDLITEDSFTVLGVNSVHWIQPSDWTAVAINSVTAYWVRFIVTSVGAAPDAPTQQSRLPYTVVTPFVDVDAAQVGGDITALASMYVQNVSDDSIYNVKLQARRVICSLRSLARGTNFSPFINISNQNIVGVSGTPTNDDFEFYATTLSPTGEAGRFTPAAAAALASVVQIEFQGEELSNYIGTFRAFLRTRTYDATSERVTAQISMRFGNENPNFYTEEVEIDHITAGGCTLTDMGLFTIQPGTLNPNELYTGGVIELYLSSDSEDGTDFHVLELILMPADEWFCDTFSKTDDAIKMVGWHGLQRELCIDAIGNPRFSMRSILFDEPGGNAIDMWEIIASSPPMLQANKDQRLWFLVHDTDRDVDDTCAFEVVHAVRVVKSQRYFSMRGSR